MSSPETPHCPVCNGSEFDDTVRRDRLPAMQNYVYRAREEAIAATAGQLILAVCRSCGFAWNRTFDPGRLVYDEGYDNAVPSTVMHAYYRELAEYLGDRYDLEGGLIVDVGCGDGGFLRTICDAVPGSRGLGIDPALGRNSEESGGRITLIKDVFSPAAILDAPALIVSRHVLEHLPEPVSFLRSIRDTVGRFDGCPCFFEVPDLGWILENEAFWDLCYEHCSYYVPESLTEALRQAGLGTTSTRAAFESQYLWIEASTGPNGPSSGSTRRQDELAERALAYASTERATIASTHDQLCRLKAEGCAIAVWGMATKGVLFSILVDPEVSLIDFCIDMNTNKQDCFVPSTGHKIDAPDVLRAAADSRPLAVLIMNENYRDEIELTCREMGVEPSFLAASDLRESRNGPPAKVDP